MSEQNPYASPVDTEKGTWDHTRRLFLAMVKTLGVFIFVAILLDLAIFTQTDMRYGGRTLIDAVIRQSETDRAVRENARNWDKVVQSIERMKAAEARRREKQF